jgi:hypothetical protein
MKTLLTIIFFSMLFIIACKKDSNNEPNTPVTEKGITYPDSVYLGKNILSYADSTVLTDGIEYEIGAILEKDASLSVVITNYPVLDTVSSHSTSWSFSNEIGWVVGDYDDIYNTQEFRSSQSGKIGSMIEFSSYGQIGKCRIDFYENGNLITRTLHFSWH